MSLGYGGVAKLIIDDGSVTEYLYGSFNFNLGVNEKNINYDGIISIDNDCFYEPEIHSKKKKMPSGRKKQIEKRIRRDVPIEEFVDSGKIRITNCQNTWKVYDNDIDMVAMTLLRKIFNEYQMEGMKKEVTCFFK